MEAFNATSDSAKKVDIALKRILKPFLLERPISSNWLDKELEHIFEEARGLPNLPKDATRYFCKKNPDGEDSDCDHGPADECWCYFTTTASAGIPEFAPKAGSIRKDKKACITFVHNLVTQFLMILAQSKMELWTDEEKRFLRESIKMTKPSADDDEHDEQGEHDEDDFFEDDRTRYLVTDSELQDLALSESNEENDLPFRRLCSTLGRRMLTLSVCVAGEGLHFAEKQPLRYWDVAGLAEKASPRAIVDKQLYPTRVINTRTYEFETDVLLYQNDYVILSHTWMTKGKEVDYSDATTKGSLLRAKIAHLETKIANLNKNQEAAEPEGERKGAVARIKKLQDELDELKKQTKGKDDPLSSGEKKLAKAIAAARDQEKSTYLWVDNCCIDKTNMTELVEAISSMGDWYKNAQASSWIRTLFLFWCRC